MILLTEYFEFQDHNRKLEVIESIKENSSLEQIEQILLFSDRVSEEDIKILEKLPKVKIIKMPHRCRFSDLFSYANNNLSGKKCIVCNNDISFTDSLEHIQETNIDNMFLCLTRWDLLEDGSIEFKQPKQSRKHSQDSWIFKAPLPQKMINDGDIFFGKPGCDNMIAYLAVVSGMLVLNPSELIISKHHHLSNSRNYKQNKRGTPSNSEKVGHHSLYMNVGTSKEILYNTENLVYKLQRAWKPKDKVFHGNKAVSKAIEFQEELTPLWRQAILRFKY